MSANAEAPTAALVARYDWQQDEDMEDEYCVDRLTGREVVRYDLGDPANYAVSHGGWSKREWLEREGLDPDAEIDIAQAAVRIGQWEVDCHARVKARRAEREREESEARDVFDVISKRAARRFRFDREHWRNDEERVLRPALERAGYRDVGFHMIEEDSFGPLIRGVVATDPSGKRVRFYYG